MAGPGPALIIWSARGVGDNAIASLADSLPTGLPDGLLDSPGRREAAGRHGGTSARSKLHFCRGSFMQLKQYRSCEGLGTKHVVGDVRRCFAPVARSDRHYAVAHYEMARNRSAVYVFKTEFVIHLPTLARVDGARGATPGSSA
jgi:hypothetical protein